jgi:hypothetical protein
MVHRPYNPYPAHTTLTELSQLPTVVYRREVIPLLEGVVSCGRTDSKTKQVPVAIYQRYRTHGLSEECSRLKVNGRLGGTCRFHRQDLRINQARSRQQTDLPSSWRFLTWLIHGL